jgi:hypothetical protein
MWQFKYLRITDACYHSVPSLLSSCLHYKKLKIKTYKPIILSVVLYGYKTWSLILKEHRLWAFQNRVLRRIIGSKMKDVARGWRRLYKEIRNLYATPSIIRVIKSRRT